MDVIIADSRGRGLETEMQNIHPNPENLTVIYSSGAKINSIKRTAHQFKRNHPHQEIHFYIMGGYCDVNERVGHRIRGDVYEEFIFREDLESAVGRVTSMFEDLCTELID